MEYYKVEQGTALPLSVTLEDASDNAVSYLGTETLASTLQAGPDQPTLCVPTTAWLVPGSGTLTITVSAAQTALLTPGVYLLRTWLTSSGGDPIGVYQCAVGVEAGPASAVVLPTYTTYARMVELAPWVKLCYDPTVHLSGFLRERTTARKILDNLILRLFRGNTIGVLGGSLYANLQWSQGWRRSTLPSQLLKGWLDSNCLLVTDQVDRINAWLAVAEVGRQMIGMNNAYACFGSAAAEMASSEISSCTALIDINGDGIGEITIPLGAANPIFT